MNNHTTQILNAADIRTTLQRIAGEICERNPSLRDIVLVGIQKRGVPMARRIAAALSETEGQHVPVGQLDVTLYRDDLSLRKPMPLQKTAIDTDITGCVVVLVDDVLFSGRTARAALNALTDIGRPARIQLAVLMDRGHRALPIRADFVGKHVPTAPDERVDVRLHDSDNDEDEVVILTDGEA